MEDGGSWLNRLSRILAKNWTPQGQMEAQGQA